MAKKHPDSVYHQFDCLPGVHEFQLSGIPVHLWEDERYTHKLLHVFVLSNPEGANFLRTLHKKYSVLQRAYQLFKNIQRKESELGWDYEARLRDLDRLDRLCDGIPRLHIRVYSRFLPEYWSLKSHPLDARIIERLLTGKLFDGHFGSRDAWECSHAEWELDCELPTRNGDTNSSG